MMHVLVHKGLTLEQSTLHMVIKYRDVGVTMNKHIWNFEEKKHLPNEPSYQPNSSKI